MGEESVENPKVFIMIIIREHFSCISMKGD